MVDYSRQEEEIRNYFLALQFLEKALKQKKPFSKKLILQVQAIVEKGASKDKIGLRGEMPPGMLFAVYDTQSGRPEYIPPMANEIETLLDELVTYVRTTDDHPLLVAAIVHYQLVTIHPFEDGNGRTARLLSGYMLDIFGYDFMGIGSLEEYFAYDLEEYYRALQMGLPALYYSGRCDPPHPEIWLNYFLRMVELYSGKVCELSKTESQSKWLVGFNALNAKEQAFLRLLLQSEITEFSPIEMSKKLGVTNRTIINRCVKLTSHGFLQPILVNERIRSYKLTPVANLIQEV